jgi:hypothetical protein
MNGAEIFRPVRNLPNVTDNLTSDAPGNPASSLPAGSAAANSKSRWRAFWDFFVLFSGISTASNLSRTRRDPILTRGLFLFRPGRKQPRP